MGGYEGKDRRKEHWCLHENFLGKVSEFMESQKGNKVLFGGIISAIILQIGAFLVMWGGLTTRVTMHDESIKMFAKKFDNIKLIGYVQAAEK